MRKRRNTCVETRNNAGNASGLQHGINNLPTEDLLFVQGLIKLLYLFVYVLISILHARFFRQIHERSAIEIKRFDTYDRSQINLYCQQRG